MGAFHLDGFVPAEPSLLVDPQFGQIDEYLAVEAFGPPLLDLQEAHMDGEVV